MDTNTANGVMEKLCQSQESYAKAMEMIGFFSAGTIGFVVALRPQGQEPTPIELEVALVLLFIAVLTTIFWFMGKGHQYYQMARKIMDSQGSEVRVKEAWWTRTSRVLALSTFVSGCYFLFQSL